MAVARRSGRPARREPEIEVVASDVMGIAIKTNDRLVIAPPRGAVKTGRGSLLLRIEPGAKPATNLTDARWTPGQVTQPPATRYPVELG